MLRTIRMLGLAVVVAASLLLGASVASADSISVGATLTGPRAPGLAIDISWE